MPKNGGCGNDVAENGCTLLVLVLLLELLLLVNSSCDVWACACD
jgi:hypothetical protein